MNTPELDKQRRARDEGHSQEIGEFLEWLPTQGIHLAEYVQVEGYEQPQLWTMSGTITQLLARYFDVDLEKVDEEARALLEEIRR